MPHLLLAGVGRSDITPPLGTQLMGYPDPYGKRTAERVRDPLHATALVFESGGKRAAIVSLDVGVIEDAHVRAIRQGVQARTGIDGATVSVCTIQTHSAPRTQLVWGWCDLDTDYIDRVMIPGAIEAVVKASAATAPARMGIGVTRSEAGVNRRGISREHTASLNFNPWALYDPELTVLRFENAKGTLANLIHYGAHPTVLHAESRVISRDWPGIMIDRMEQLTGAPTLYINGAVGDIAPRTSFQSCVGDGEVALWETGARAALDAMTAWRSIKDLRGVAMHVHTGGFELPYRPLTPIEEAQRGLAAAEADKDKPGGGMMFYKHYRAVLAAHARPPASGKPYLQTLTALGPVVLVPFPGEPFAETVLRMRHESPFQYTLCASTSNGNNAYFPTKEALARGGYEAWVGRALGAYLLSDDIADVLVDRNREMLQALHKQVYPALEA